MTKNTKPDKENNMESSPGSQDNFQPDTEKDAGKSKNSNNAGLANRSQKKIKGPGKSLSELHSETALDKAQEIAYDAMNAPTRKAAISLAREALKISPDCADAYVILAEEYASNWREAIHYYQAGVAAGERALGPEIFKKYSGHFWSLIETRPYMRARAGLATALWETGKHQEAITHFKEILKLNPNDNLGIRYNLVAYLSEIGDTANLKKLLSSYDEPTAAWLFSQALLLFSEQGDSEESRRALNSAASANPHVVPYLTGRKALPRQMPESIRLGQKDEAICYVDEFQQGWENTPGSLSWLNTVFPQKLRALPNPKVKGVPEVFLKAFELNNEKPDSKIKAGDVYILKVTLKYFPGVWRKIEIKGTQTLHHLHKAIVNAFERDDDHLYAFFMNNRAWDDSQEYGPPYGETDARNSTRAKLGQMGLQVKSKFLYIFDFGDCWEHPVTVMDIRQETPGEKYPRITGGQGEAPPQYPPTEEDE